MKVKTHTFRGNKFEIDYGSTFDGLCENPKGEKKPQIRVSCEPFTKKELETLIHEALHACVFAKSEDVVEETARDLFRFLWRLGYRRLDEALLPKYDKRIQQIKSTQT